MLIELTAAELSIIWQALEALRDNYDSQLHMRGELTADQFNRLLDRVGQAESAARDAAAGDPQP
jgi:hypothetical protein